MLLKPSLGTRYVAWYGGKFKWIKIIKPMLLKPSTWRIYYNMADSMCCLTMLTTWQNRLQIAHNMAEQRKGAHNMANCLN